MEIKNILKNWRFWLAIFILIIGIVLNQLFSIYILENNENLPILNDFILDKIPYFNCAIVYDVIVLFSIFLFIFYIAKYDKEKTIYFIYLFSILQFIRAFFIVLTPMGAPSNDAGLVDSASFIVGMYPSGHTGATFLAFLLARKWKLLFLILSVLVISLLFLGRGHYSIDILSAILFSYAIFCFGERHLKNYLYL